MTDNEIENLINDQLTMLYIKYPFLQDKPKNVAISICLDAVLNWGAKPKRKLRRKK